MLVVKPYDQLYTTKLPYVFLRSGRVSGKTKSSAQKVFYNSNKYANKDILICRASYSDLRSSLFEEIQVVIQEEDMESLFKIRTFPLSITNKKTNCTIHFKGIGGSDYNRTKGFRPKNKLSMIFIDETQQLPNRSNLDQALATFRRHLDPDIAQIIMAFNPEPMNMHWLNQFYRVCKKDVDYLCIESSYKDIANVLNKLDLRRIEMERILNPRNYDYMYMGITNGLFGGVYYTFDRNNHLIDEEYAMSIIKTFRVHSIFFGVDGAHTRDCTGVVPLLMLYNGQTIAVDRFFHDPKVTRPLSNEQLYPYLKKYFENIVKKFNIRRDVPKYVVVDPASADLQLHLRYKLISNNWNVMGYNDKEIVNMAKVVQNVFSKNLCLISDSGGYYNYVTGRFEYEEYPLVEQLESVVWTETGDKFDDVVPNDLTDALTYALNMIYNNPNNIHLPRVEYYYDLKELEKIRRL